MYAPRNVGGLVTNRTLLRPQASAVAAAFSLIGLALDRESFLSALIKLTAGAVTGAPSAQQVSWKVQDSADGATFADILPSQANPVVVGADITAVNGNSVLEIDCSGLRRFIRVVATVAFTGGTAPTIFLSSEATLGGGKLLPTVHV